MAKRPRARHQPSTIDRLDPEIQTLIGELRTNHGWTIDEIRAKLIELGANVSRSALGRHVRSLADVGEQLRHSREMARALAETHGDAPEHKISDLNIELMHSIILRLVTATREGDDGAVEAVQFDPKEVMFLTSALSSLATARKSDASRRIADKKEAKRLADEAVLSAVAEGVGKAGSGITAETVDFIRKAVLGGDG